MKGLSICIPIYNFNCIDSIKTLCKQIEALQINAEVYVIDDASNIILNELINFRNPFYIYKKLTTNIGRSKIRNLLVEKSKFNHILFLDGDSGIPKNFIKNYLSIIDKHPNAIICGGRKHHHNQLKKSNRLRYNYGVKFEDSKSSVRSTKPYHSFMTNNFISPKAIMKNIPFNEEINKYGQEDTFFGYELKINNIKIIHIDNAIIHLDLETNQKFTENTKSSIKNLILLNENYPEFIEYSKLLTFIHNHKIFRVKIVKIVSLPLSKMFEAIAKSIDNSYCFQMFKLFYAISFSK